MVHGASYRRVPIIDIPFLDRALTRLGEIDERQGCILDSNRPHICELKGRSVLRSRVT
jgi:hypothetical protein